MHVRDAKNHEEVWLLDHLEAFDFEDPAFRSRDYVLAIDESTGEKVGFGRLRVHRTDAGSVCEVTNLGVLESFRGEGAGAKLLERLVETARDDGFDTVYGLSPQSSYLEQFGFEPIDPDALPPVLADRFESFQASDPEATPVVLDVAAFAVPRRLQRRAAPEEEQPEESPEDFGIDPDAATYKYDVN
jgi:N-acetylglutamate synthase-like GNAT family acetyltransferase